MHPVGILIIGIVIGFFGAIEMYRQLEDRNYKNYYDEFLQNMAKLTEDQFEKTLQIFRDFREMAHKKDEEKDEKN